MFEIIYISIDRDESSFTDSFSRMPWLALPYADGGPHHGKPEMLRRLFDITVRFSGRAAKGQYSQQ
jgi:hypothetical protein